MKDSEFSKITMKTQGMTANLEIGFLEVTILLGSVKLMLDHPGTQQFGMQFHAYTAGLRAKLLTCLVDMGLSSKQIEALNTEYATETGSISDGVVPTRKIDPRRRHIRIVKNPAEFQEESEGDDE